MLSMGSPNPRSDPIATRLSFCATSDALFPDRPRHQVRTRGRPTSRGGRDFVRCMSADSFRAQGKRQRGLVTKRASEALDPIPPSASYQVAHANAGPLAVQKTSMPTQKWDSRFLSVDGFPGPVSLADP